MQVATTEIAAAQSVQRVTTKKRSNQDITQYGSPVYTYRSLFNEFSQLGSDLVVESYGEDEF